MTPRINKAPRASVVGLALVAGSSLLASPVLQAQELEWATSAGGIGSEGGGGIATDQRGNSYVTGSFRGTATFGAGEANETVLSSVGDESSDIFLAKYAPGGNLLWAKSAGGAGGDSGSGIATDQRGNIYVTGDFTGMATFGAGEANETVLSSAGRTNVFVAKYSRAGALLWAKSARSVALGSGLDIATDRRGNSYVTGSFLGTATFGAGEANETVLEDGGLFIAQYSSAGDLLWARSAGPDAGGQAIATDQRGDSYVTGSFGGPATFGAGEANETVLESTARGAFAAKYANDGSLVWARSDDGPDGDFGSGIAIDQAGNSYVTGSFDGAITFGAGEPKEVTLISQDGTDNADAFVAKYGPKGKFLWARRAGTGDEEFGDAGTGIATDRGHIYVTGFFSDTATFDAGKAQAKVITSAGLTDVFVATYTPGGKLLSVKSAGGPDGDIAGDIATDSRGDIYITGSFTSTATFGAGQRGETVLHAAGGDFDSDVFVARYFAKPPRRAKDRSVMAAMD